MSRAILSSVNADHQSATSQPCDTVGIYKHGHTRQARVVCSIPANLLHVFRPQKSRPNSPSYISLSWTGFWNTGSLRQSWLDKVIETLLPNARIGVTSQGPTR